MRLRERERERERESERETDRQREREGGGGERHRQTHIERGRQSKVAYLNIPTQGFCFNAIEVRMVVMNVVVGDRTEPVRDTGDINYTKSLPPALSSPLQPSPALSTPPALQTND